MQYFEYHTQHLRIVRVINIAVICILEVILHSQVEDRCYHRKDDDRNKKNTTET